MAPRKKSPEGWETPAKKGPAPIETTEEWLGRVVPFQFVPRTELVERVESLARRMGVKIPDRFMDYQSNESLAEMVHEIHAANWDGVNLQGHVDRFEHDQLEARKMRDGLSDREWEYKRLKQQLDGIRGRDKTATDEHFLQLQWQMALVCLSSPGNCTLSFLLAKRLPFRELVNLHQYDPLELKPVPITLPLVRYTLGYLVQEPKHYIPYHFLWYGQGALISDWGEIATARPYGSVKDYYGDRQLPPTKRWEDFEPVSLLMDTFAEVFMLLRNWSPTPRHRDDKPATLHSEIRAKVQCLTDIQDANLCRNEGVLQALEEIRREMVAAQKPTSPAKAKK